MKVVFFWFFFSFSSSRLAHLIIAEIHLPSAARGGRLAAAQKKKNNLPKSGAKIGARGLFRGGTTSEGDVM